VADDERLRVSVGDFLDERGYATLVAGDTRGAIEQLADLQHPCLVLADLLSFAIDYGQLLAALEPGDRLATLPVVLVAPSDSDRRRPTVKKPLDLDILFRIVLDHCCHGGSGGTKKGGQPSIQPPTDRSSTA
jgi:CheY-like chemotaxis protein